MVRIARVWAEHHEPDTIGIGEDRPRISWSFAGDDRNWEQICYEVEAKHDDGRLSSVTIESSQSRLVPWPFRPLSSRERVEVRVRVAGTANSRSDWSSPLVIEAGLLRSDDWSGCQLIEPSQPTETVPGKHRPVIFRRRLVLPEGAAAKRARLYITAHGIYEAHINGFRIGDQLLAPGWTSYQERLAYQTYEIEPQLLAGQENQIDVDVAEGWFCGSLAFLRKHNLYGSRIGLIALILVEMDDGTIVRTGTDAEWEWAHGPMVEAGLLDGVTYDAREGLSASTVWRTVQTGSDGCITRLTAPDGPPIRQTQELPVRAILTSPSGKTILDFGQNFVGWVRLRSVSGPAGTTIRFRHAEVLEDGEIGVRPLRSAKCLDTLIIDGAAPIPWEPKFTFHGFRYVEVYGRPAASPLTVEDVVGVVIHSDMRRTGHFRCSDPLLNRLHENIVWSMRGNFVGIPTDCPQRDERLGWTGDINMFADTASFLFDVSGMLSSWMKDMMVEQNAANGVVPLVIPYILGDFGPGKSAEAVWGDVAVMLPWALYVVSGDIQLLQRHYQSMKDWLNAIPRSASGLWKQAGHKLADWLDPSAPADDPSNAMTDMYLVCDAFLVHVTTLIARVAATLNAPPEEQAFYKGQIADLRDAFAHEYITPSGRLACDTKTAYALALQFNLLSTPEQQIHAAERLSLLIRQRSRFKISTGFAGTPYLGHALTKAGKSNVFYRMLLHRECPSWLYPVTTGATTVWERWDSMLPDGRINPGDMTSFNHYALGAVASWMHRTIAGLEPVEPGWRVFRVEPVPGGNLQWAEAEYRSVYGDCRLRWEIKREGKQQRLWLEVVVPPNTKCQVRLPGSADLIVVGSGQRTWEVDYHPQEWPVRALQPPFRPPDDILPEGEVVPHEW
ncbi:hypothetical protein V6000_007268 [Aspergillus fumigatus]|nr:hypothetical protein CNMCM8686_000404 [Aspergillus fumigatus]KAH1995162.1 hypothetical protein KXV33_001951 [Aspergillus fumigatus]